MNDHVPMRSPNLSSERELLSQQSHHRPPECGYVLAGDRPSSKGSLKIKSRCEMEQLVFSSLVGIVFFVFATLPALLAYVMISIKQQEQKTHHHVCISRQERG